MTSLSQFCTFNRLRVRQAAPQLCKPVLSPTTILLSANMQIPVLVVMTHDHWITISPAFGKFNPFIQDFKGRYCIPNLGYVFALSPQYRSLFLVVKSSIIAALTQMSLVDTPSINHSWCYSIIYIYIYLFI